MAMARFIAISAIIMVTREERNSGMRAKKSAPRGIPTSMYGMRRPYLFHVLSLAAPK